MPFVMRTVIIYALGGQYIGLNGLFTSILQVLNLAELGVGSAMVYSMYKPIVEDDTATICALMRLYRKYYRFIALVVMVGGLIVLPFLPYLVKADTVPSDINLYVLYLLNLSATVASYCLFAYKNCLLLAFQRTDIESRVSIAVSTVSYTIQIVLLFLMRNYYVYTLILVVSNLVTNLVTAFVVDRLFPKYHPKGNISTEETKAIHKRVRDLFTAKLGGTITGSADTIVISAFLGLYDLAVYQNYYFIMNAVISFVFVVFNSVIAGIGNSLVVESTEKNYLDFRKLSFLINWITIIAVSCFMCLYQPFIKLWVGEKYILKYPFVILFCVYFYVIVVQQLACVYKDAGGIWHQDRWRPLLTGITNLGLNLLFVQKFGLYAILLSTILSYIVVAMPWLIHNLFTTVFYRKPTGYVLFVLVGFVASLSIGTICYYVCSFISIQPVLDIVLKFIICVVLSNLIIILLYRKHCLYNQMLDLVDNVFNGRMHDIILMLKTKDKKRE